MKKMMCFIAVAALLTTVFPAVASAYGGHSGRGRGNTSSIVRYALCTAEDCDVYGPHEHNGTWYCNQNGVNWDAYGVCTVEDCAALGLHVHDGTWYHCADYPNNPNPSNRPDDSGYPNSGGCCGGRGRNRR